MRRVPFVPCLFAIVVNEGCAAPVHRGILRRELGIEVWGRCGKAIYWKQTVFGNPAPGHSGFEVNSDICMPFADLRGAPRWP